MFNGRTNHLLLILLLGPCVAFGASPPKPFTPVAATPTEFRGLDRSVALGNLLLPAQLIAAKGELLSAPIEVFADPASSLKLIPSTITAKVLAHFEDSAYWHFAAESSDFRVTSSVAA